MPFRVGLTGGIGSGKSEVARIFATLGAVIIDADVLAREAVQPNTPGLAQIQGLWPEVVLSDGTLDRKALGAKIFADDDARITLEHIIHPRVRALAAQQEAALDADAVVIHMVPLLFEKGYASECDRTVVVIAPDDVRIDRVRERDHLSDEAISRRIATQIAPEEARRRADIVIENDGDLASLRARATAAFIKIRHMRAL